MKTAQIKFTNPEGQRVICTFDGYNVQTLIKHPPTTPGELPLEDRERGVISKNEWSAKIKSLLDLELLESYEVIQN